MKKLILGLTIALGALASSVTCPVHAYASCFDTGRVAPTGSGAHLWHCSCGDDVWVR